MQWPGGSMEIIFGEASIITSTTFVVSFVVYQDEAPTIIFSRVSGYWRFVAMYVL